MFNAFMTRRRLAGIKMDRDDLVVGLAAAVTLLSLVVYGKGIPYVLDANETFSSILHVKNLLNYDFSLAWGLADETASTAVVAHPYVHTHQGNFPRLYAALIYLLGARSPEAQVTVTALTVGVASLVLLFRSFKLEFGRAIAATAVFLLLTDYIMFLQWQVVTYRVWHTFFIAMCLYSVSAYAVSRSRIWFISFFIVWYFLFYYELTFAIFTAVTVGTWTLWRLRESFRRTAIVIAVQLIGSVLGAATVVVQLVAYLGWNGFVQDISLTYSARNATNDPLQMAGLAQAFAREHNVVFFNNLADGSVYRTLSFAIESLTTWGLQVYSPGLFLAFAVCSVGAMIAVAPDGWVFRRLGAHPFLVLFGGFAAWLLPGMIGAAAALLFCLPALVLRHGENEEKPALLGPLTVMLWVIWVACLLVDNRVLGGAGTVDVSFGGMPAAILSLLLGLGCAWSLDKLAGAGSRMPSRGDAGRMLMFLLLLVVLAGLAQSTLPYGTGTFWSAVFASSGGYAVVVKGGLFCLVYCVAHVLLRREVIVGGALRHALPGAFLMLLCALSGLLVAIIMMPGYVYSGYHARGQSFFVTFTALFSSVGLVCLANASREFLRLTRVRHALGIAGLVAVIVIGGGWLFMQARLAVLLPADGFSRLVEELRRHSGKTLVANTYSAPFFIAANGWSYTAFARPLIRSKPNEAGYGYGFDKTYLWLADEKVNPDYEWPELYVCYSYFSMVDLRLAHQYSPGEPFGTWRGKSVCDRNTLVKRARKPDDGTWPHLKILSESSDRGRQWAIIALDRDAPPFFRCGTGLPGEPHQV